MTITAKEKYITKVRELLQYASNHGYTRTVGMYNHIKDHELSDDLQYYTMELDTSGTELMSLTSYYRINMTELLFDHTFIESFTRGNVCAITPIILPSGRHTDLTTDKQELINGPERRLVLMQLSMFSKIEDRIDYMYSRFEHIINYYYGRKSSKQAENRRPKNNIREKVKKIIKR